MRWEFRLITGIRLSSSSAPHHLPSRESKCLGNKKEMNWLRRIASTSGKISCVASRRLNCPVNTRSYVLLQLHHPGLAHDGLDHLDFRRGKINENTMQNLPLTGCGGGYCYGNRCRWPFSSLEATSPPMIQALANVQFRHVLYTAEPPLSLMT